MTDRLTGKRIIAIVCAAVAIILAIIVPVAMVETVGAEEIVVHEDIMGDLTVWTEPGWKYKGLGHITRYSRSAQLDFLAAEDGTAGQAIPARFNDQGKAHIGGSVRFDLPLKHEAMLKLHKQFGSMEAVRKELVQQTIIRAVYFSGPLMSSRESAGERRSELISFIIDQSVRGVYKTEITDKDVEDVLAPPIKVVLTRDVPVLDEETGKPLLDDEGNPVLKKEPFETTKVATKKVKVVQPQKGKDGQILVQEESALTEFGIKLYNLTVSKILYDPKVKEQIDRQRAAIMDIQTKMAQAKAAEQEAVTAEKEGQARSARAKWEQEVKKATAITQAQQAKAVALEQASESKAVALVNANKKREVAEQDLLAAKLERQAQVERAKGQARAKKLILEADGALKQKLDAWITVQQAWAAAIGQQRLVPEIQMGGSGAKAGEAGMTMMQILALKAARDLQLDMKITK